MGQLGVSTALQEPEQFWLGGGGEENPYLFRACCVLGVFAFPICYA